jgi:hypothetical protein
MTGVDAGWPLPLAANLATALEEQGAATAAIPLSVATHVQR